MAENKFSKLSFNSNESFPFTMDDETGELAIDFSKMAIGGINSTNYPHLETIGDTFSGGEDFYKTGIYRADGSTEGLPYDAKKDSTYIALIIENDFSHQWNENTINPRYLVILIEDFFNVCWESRTPRMWIGIPYKIGHGSNSFSYEMIWSSFDSRGGCGRDIKEYYYDNLIEDFLNDKDTGFYWTEKYVNNAPNYETRYIVEKISHGDNGKITCDDEYVHVATYKATETPARPITKLPAEAPVIWNGYVYLETLTNKKHIRWFKA